MEQDNDARESSAECHHCADHAEDEFSTKRELIVIGVAAALFVLGLVFRTPLHDTPFSFAEYLVFFSAYLLGGWNVLSRAGRNLLHGRVFDENSLMVIATVGAILIHELPEAVGVMLFFMVGEYFQGLSVRRSRRSIKALLDIRPEYAHLKINGKLKKVSPEEVKVGDTIIVKPGERIPLDGVVTAGSSRIDTAALTGESVPIRAKVGDTVLAGMINQTQVLTISVTKIFSESSVSKILELTEHAISRKSQTERFITRFARYYTPAVVAVALGVAFLPPLFLGGIISEWVYRALVLLVISCPCALVISIPLGYFGGVGGASHHGILVKGSNFLDSLTEVRTVVFDKTGTLTKGVFKVTKVVPRGRFSEKGLLRLAAKAESHSNHPIAQSIREAYGKDVNPAQVTEYEEIAGHGVRAKVGSREILAGNDRLLHREHIEHDTCDVIGTVVHLAVDGIYAGYLIISDELKEDAGQAIKSLRECGVRKIVMLTGDDEAVAKSVAQELELDAYHAELLPEDKVEAIERLLSKAGKGEKVAFVGDGINDAPVLARADIGIAMGALGSDAAIETADVVIMNDAPSKVAEAIGIARRTRRIVWQNIGLAMAVKGGFIIFGTFGLVTMWQAVFADVGVALIAVFNAMRVLR